MKPLFNKPRPNFIQFEKLAGGTYTKISCYLPDRFLRLHEINFRISYQDFIQPFISIQGYAKREFLFEFKRLLEINEVR
jgi:hypothetical protein